MNSYNILVLEDSPTDAEIVLRALKKTEIVFSAKIVGTKKDFIEAISSSEHIPDIILADYSLPSFHGLEAVELGKKYCPETPIIFVSGAIGEEIAVETLKRGATDYVLKDGLFRLGPAVSRALKESGEKKILLQTERERMRIEQQLISENRAKDEFLALLSHELRNPLGALALNVEIIAEKVKDPDTMDRIGTIYQQVRHITRLLDDLLDITRITKGTIALKKENVDLEKIALRVIESIRPLAESKKQTIELHFEPVRLIADPVRLEQILINILTNAVKYTGEGGYIRMDTEKQNANAIIRIKDTGMGIAAEMLPKIFNLFIRADQSLARAEGGLGIGLTLARKLAVLHGGNVAARSDGIGKGSEFTVVLPALDSAEKQADTASSKKTLESQMGAVTSIKKKKVLVADDNRNLADAIGEILQKLGADVSVVYDGEGAVSESIKLHPDIALIDIGLPLLDGFAVAQSIRKKFGNDIKIIAISGYGQEKDKHRAFESGFDLYLVKPVSIKDLKAIAQE
ncbi:MAG: response regulator [Candidatus Paceibacterota bacterium]|jgi:signal transduction histidine kinase|nr:response regulator [Candidatus Paceibacterota bacterium]